MLTFRFSFFLPSDAMDCSSTTSTYRAPKDTSNLFLSQIFGGFFMSHKVVIIPTVQAIVDIRKWRRRQILPKREVTKQRNL